MPLRHGMGPGRRPGAIVGDLFGRVKYMNSTCTCTAGSIRSLDNWNTQLRSLKTMAAFSTVTTSRSWRVSANVAIWGVPLASFLCLTSSSLWRNCENPPVLSLTLGISPSTSSAITQQLRHPTRHLHDHSVEGRGRRGNGATWRGDLAARPSPRVWVGARRRGGHRRRRSRCRLTAGTKGLLLPCTVSSQTCNGFEKSRLFPAFRVLAGEI
jgi:hypothetical protein